jgi:hypothetical protein
MKNWNGKYPLRGACMFNGSEPKLNNLFWQTCTVYYSNKDEVIFRLGNQPRIFSSKEHDRFKPIEVAPYKTPHIKCGQPTSKKSKRPKAMNDNNWNGEGKPSLGHKNVEVFNDYFGDNAEYEKCEILFIGEFSVIYNSISCKERAAKLSNCKFRVAPNTAEVAKKKAIDELTNFLRSKYYPTNNMIATAVIEDGYTKSKVKPLSFDQYSFIARGFTNHKQDYKTLIKNGHCIGSAD